MDDTRRRTAPRMAKRTQFLFEHQHTVEVEAKEQMGNTVRESSNSPKRLRRTRYLPAIPPALQGKDCHRSPTSAPIGRPSKGEERSQEVYANHNPSAPNEIPASLHSLESLDL